MGNSLIGLRRVLAIVCALAAAAAVIWLTVGPRKASETAPSAEVSDGRVYLSEQQLKDPAEVESRLLIRQQERLRQQQLEAQSAAASSLLAAASSANAGTGDAFGGTAPTGPTRSSFVTQGIWTGFTNYIILGDSRAVGFWYYRFLDKSRVLADGGDTIRNVADHLDTIAKLQPATVYFCYGLNDAGIGYWKTGEAYAAEMLQVIDSVRQAAPNAVIVVSSVLPATPAALQRSPGWKRIQLFNESLRKELPSHGIAFADNDALAAECMSEMWDSDGVHLHREFYPYWAANLLAVTAVNSTPASSATSVSSAPTTSAVSSQATSSLPPVSSAESVVSPAASSQPSAPDVSRAEESVPEEPSAPDDPSVSSLSSEEAPQDSQGEVAP